MEKQKIGIKILPNGTAFNGYGTTQTPPHVLFDMWCEDWNIKNLSPPLENLRKRLEKVTYEV